MTWGLFVEPLAWLCACFHFYSCIPGDAIAKTYHICLPFPAGRVFARASSASGFTSSVTGDAGGASPYGTPLVATADTGDGCGTYGNADRVDK